MMKLHYRLGMDSKQEKIYYTKNMQYNIKVVQPVCKVSNVMCAKCCRGGIKIPHVVCET